MQPSSARGQAAGPSKRSARAGATSQASTASGSAAAAHTPMIPRRLYWRGSTSPGDGCVAANGGAYLWDIPTSSGLAPQDARAERRPASGMTLNSNLSP